MGLFVGEDWRGSCVWKAVPKFRHKPCSGMRAWGNGTAVCRGGMKRFFHFFFRRMSPRSSQPTCRDGYGRGGGAVDGTVCLSGWNEGFHFISMHEGASSGAVASDINSRVGVVLFMMVALSWVLNI